MKVTRNILLIITASLGGLIILYSLVRYFFGIGLSEGLEKYAFDTVIIIALGCYMYNRKLAKEERQAKAAAEEAERRAAEEPEESEETEDSEESESYSDSEEEDDDDDENLPHWERRKKNEDDQ